MHTTHDQRHVVTRVDAGRSAGALTLPRTTTPATRGRVKDGTRVPAPLTHPTAPVRGPAAGPQAVRNRRRSRLTACRDRTSASKSFHSHVSGRVSVPPGKVFGAPSSLPTSNSRMWPTPTGGRRSTHHIQSWRWRSRRRRPSSPRSLREHQAAARCHGSARRGLG